MFDQVVIKDVTQQARNIHLAVHPFPIANHINMMTRKGDYGHERDFDTKEPVTTMAEWQKRLAVAMWDGIPGLSTLFFVNGSITLHHNGVFEDALIIEGATSIIRPALEQELQLRNLEAPNDR